MMVKWTLPLWIAFSCLCLAEQPRVSVQAVWAQNYSRGEKLRGERRYQEAMEAFQLAAKAAENFAPEDPRRAITLNNLGFAMKCLGRFSEADRFYLRARLFGERSLADDPLARATILQNLGALRFLQNRLPESERYCRLAYKLRVKARADKLTIVVSLEGLAVVADVQRKFRKALRLHQECLQLLREEGVTPEKAAIYQNLGVLFLETNRPAEAERMLLTALPLYRRDEAEPSDLVSLLQTLAEAKAANHRPEEAEPLYQEALAICARSVPAGHPRAGAVLYSYSRFLRSTDRVDEAARMEEQSISVMQAVREQMGPTRTVDVYSLLEKSGSGRRTQ